MPNIFPFIANKKWGQLATFLTVLAMAGTPFVWGAKYIHAQGVKASTIESSVVGTEKDLGEFKVEVAKDLEEIKQTIPTAEELAEAFCPRHEIESINAEREKRFNEAKESLERSMELIRAEQLQFKTEQQQFQQEQRKVNLEILKRLPPQ